MQELKVYSVDISWKSWARMAIVMIVAWFIGFILSFSLARLMFSSII